MYHNYQMPRNTNYVYRNTPVTNNPNDERFIFPFLVGGVAGTALGYGLANNNNNNQVFYPYPPYPNYYYGGMQPYPIYYSGRW